MAEATDHLSAKQHKAIAALLTCTTIGEAAAAIGVGERTLHTWLGDTAFTEAYRAARREAVGQAIARLQQSSSDAVQVLIDIMKDTTKPATVRVAAAAKVLDTSIRVVELEDLENRLSALEAANAAIQTPHR